MYVRKSACWMEEALVRLLVLGVPSVEGSTKDIGNRVRCLLMSSAFGTV